MSDLPADQLMAAFLTFCRVGGCMLVAPGFSSPRIPVHVRLFVAFGITLAITPLVAGPVAQDLPAADDMQLRIILHELVTGVFIGLMARFFFLALQFSTTAISNFIGLAGIPGIALEEAETGSPLATLVSTAAVTLVFVLGLHVELLKAVLESYRVIPRGEALSAEALLSHLLLTLSETWLLALRLAGPFLLYGVIVNFGLGLGNRFAQQISMYHATTGAVMLGGFLLLYVLWGDWVMVFMGSYRSWLLEGGF